MLWNVIVNIFSHLNIHHSASGYWQFVVLTPSISSPYGHADIPPSIQGPQWPILQFIHENTIDFQYYLLGQ